MNNYFERCQRGKDKLLGWLWYGLEAFFLFGAKVLLFPLWLLGGNEPEWHAVTPPDWEKESNE